MDTTGMVLLAADHHVHSTFSADGRSSVVASLAAARSRGLGTICLVAHVGTATTWAPVFAHSVRVAARVASAHLTLLSGVEVSIVDSSGRLDLPAGAPPVDRILIADHAYPSPTGSVAPANVWRDLTSRAVTADQVVDTLTEAMIAAMGRVGRQTGARPQLAHPFSLLPRLGLTEDAVGEDHLRALASAARDYAASVECNEKWRCPRPRVLAAFAAAGVPLVASSGSHRADSIGVYDYVAWATAPWAGVDAASPAGEPPAGPTSDRAVR